MIILRCEHCQARVQVPSPGVYKCHSCGRTLEVNADDYTGILKPQKPKHPSSDIPDPVPAEDIQKHVGPTCRRHPDLPGEQFCTSCGDFLCGMCAIRVEHRYYCRECLDKQINKSTPGAGRENSDYPPGESSIPMENSRKLGLPMAFLLTIKEALFYFTRFFDKTGKDTLLFSAVLFAVVAQFILKVADFIAIKYFSYGFAVDISKLPSELQKFAKAFYSTSILKVFIAPLGIVLGLFLLAGIYHIAVILVKGSGTYKTTLKITAYSAAAQLFGLFFFFIPVLPGLLVFIFALLIVIQGCIKLHGLSEGQALFVALFPIMVIVLLIVIFVMAYCNTPM